MGKATCPRSGGERRTLDCEGNHTTMVEDLALVIVLDEGQDGLDPECNKIH
jgi:hypothetical protein